MQAQDKLIKDIMASSVRFRVPNYQRLYSWDEDNCEQFWEDLSRQISLNKAHFNSDKKLAHDHYLGALVVKSSGRTIENELSEFLIVDGQQRLTTISLLVAALLKSLYLYKDEKSVEAAYDPTFRKLAKSFESFIKVDTSNFIEERNSRFNYRIELIEENNELYRRLIDSYSDSADTFNYEKLNSPLAVAFKYFMKVVKSDFIDNYLNKLGKINLEGLKEIESIFSAIKFNIKLIYTTLDANDEVQQIFEALNNRGAPLTDEDLIKNYFMMAIDASDDTHSSESKGTYADTLYSNYWKAFEKEEWWREKRNNSKGQTNLGFFIYIYLMQVRQTSGHQPKASNLYRDFRDHSNKLIQKSSTTYAGMESLLLDIHKSSINFKLYDQLIADQGNISRRLPAKNTKNIKNESNYRFEEFIERVATLEAYSWQLILWLAKNKDLIPEKEFIKTINIIESWLVRRKIVKSSNTHFGIRALCELFQQTEEIQFGSLSRIVSQWVEQGTSDGTAIISFPGNSKIEDFIKNNDITEKLAKVILFSLEDSKRQGLTPRIDRNRELEHIMPQKWRDKWPLGKWETEQDRIRVIPKLGNMTLLLDDPNKTVSNKSFDDK
ncbi:MAG TPA: DUF262 domain-containing HNH endonuclease family protein, partial [Methanobacteriaceae archaeon]|nr:DUF262 domain-containing HNH endonuclease family protein [Methanobacteriaceae archaeon]